MEFAGCSNDGSFGPNVHGCRGDFDFTIKFEKIFFSLLPSSLFVAVAAPRLIALIRQPVVARGTWYKYVKLVAILILAVIQLALVGMASHAKRLASLFVASTVLDFLAVLAAAAVSYFEHSHSARPSILLGFYLPLTLLFDIAQARSMWLMSHNHSDFVFVKLFTTAMALRALVMLLESKNKRKWLLWDVKEHSPEEDSNLYSLATLFWVRDLLKVGYKSVISMADLLPLDSKLTVNFLAKHINKIHPEQFGHKKHALSRSLARVFAVQLLRCVAPRIAFVGFSLCQPLLLQSLLTYLDTPDSPDNIGYGLIGATIIVFAGTPLSQALDNYYHHRMVVTVRAALISRIYEHTTQIPLNASDDSAAVTLMSTDVERVRIGLMYIHNCWSIPLQVGISFWLIYRQLGASFAAPVAVIAICILASVVTTRIIGRLQMAWMARVQVRIGKTSNVIANMKNVKLSGLTEPIKAAIQDMRIYEIAAGNRFRGVDVIVSGFGFAPGQIAAMFLFIFTSRTLNASTIFSSVAYLALLSNPLNLLIQGSPMLISALACIQRVQNFLEKEPRKDFRTFYEKTADSKGTNVDLSTTVIKVTNASMGWEKDKYVIQNLSATIAPGLNMVIGPVASGKSTFAKGLLGETPSFKGEVFCFINAKTSGFCDQVPCLLNANIRQNITGFLPYNEARYAEVIHAAVLKPDLAILPHGDQTNIGSNGIALSGGQKQRVSLARALYQDFEVYIFDDILSGLDVDTEQKVFERVFGRNGLLKKRGVAAVLCTHSVRHLPESDHILALSAEGELVEEGSYNDLMAHKKYVYSLGVLDNSSGSDAQASDSSAVDEIQQSSDAEVIQPEPAKAPKPAVKDSELLKRNTGDIRIFLHYFKSIGVPWLIVFFSCVVGVAFFWNFPSVWLKFWVADLGPNAHHSKSFYVGVYALFACLSLIFVTGQIGIGLLIVAKVSGTSLHKTALGTLCSAPLGFFTRTDAGILINLFSQDMTLIDDELPNAFVNTLEGFAIVVGGAVVAAISSPYVVISYPFLIGLMYLVQRFYLRTSRQVRLLGLEIKTPLYTSFLDTIKGVATFRAFGWTGEAIQKNNGFLDESQRPTYLLLTVQNWLMTLLNSLIGFLACFIVILATQLRNNVGSVGAGMVSIILCGRFTATLVREYTMLENALGAISRLKAFDENTASEHLEGEDVKPPASWPEKGRVVLHNVSASYADDQATYEASSSEAEEGEKTTGQSLALRDLNLTIEPGQKVAICGRTGSGKSSSILLLMRLLNPLRNSNFTMTIDDQPLDKVDRTVLRERVISVPQDPVFLPDGSSFQSNLDPSHEATLEDCQASLEAVDLWKYVQNKGGLEAGLISDELSQGQKQLFSLGRAILRRRMRSRILSREVGDSYLSAPISEKSATAVAVEGSNGGLLILDEYSSSLDVDTDRAMQAIVRREFEGYTIIMVSHRLEMVMGFDKVVVLDAGAVVEEGVPTELAEKEGSRFRQLLLTGKAD